MPKAHLLNYTSHEIGKSLYWHFTPIFIDIYVFVIHLLPMISWYRGMTYPNASWDVCLLEHITKVINQTQILQKQLVSTILEWEC